MLTFDGCEPGANPWVEKYFHDCVMDYRDAIGFALGLCSILVWLTAQLPQFISNMKNQSSEALSIWFLVEWFAGDTLNLLGCLIQGQQLPTTTILAAYFVLMDVIMLLQYIYYGALQARRKRLRAKTLSRRRHRHASMHHYGRDDAHQHAVRLLEDSGPNADSSETRAGIDSSALATPLGGESFQGVSESEAHLEIGVGTGGSKLRTFAAATAAGVSVVCIVALALRPSPGPPGPRRHLLASSGQGLTVQPLSDDDGGASGFGRSGAIGGVSSGSVRMGLAAAGAGLSVVGRSLSEVLHPASLLGSAHAHGHAHGHRGGGSGSGGDGQGGGGDVKSSDHCSFLNCDAALLAGTAMGYLSTCFYLASRVSQIRKNLARRSTEGLSPFMFLLTMSANLCTGVSIVLRLRSMEQVKEQLPWMCGTFGTIALDMTLFYQAVTLGQEDPAGHGHHHHHHHHHQTQGQGHCHADTHGYGNGRASGGVADEEGACEGTCGVGGVGGSKLADLEAPLLGSVLQADVESDGPPTALAEVDCGTLA